MMNRYLTIKPNYLKDGGGVERIEKKLMIILNFMKS